MAQKFLCLYHDMIPALENLSDAEAGRLLIAALRYSRDGETVTLPGKEAILWPMVMAQIERDNARYKKLCETNRANISSRYDRIRPYTTVYDRNQEKEKEKYKEKEEEKESVPPDPPPGGSPSPPSKRFVPPTLDEIRAYCLERKNAVDPERFFSYYTSNGWRVGKNPMKDWQAAVRTWERSEPSFSRPAAGTGSRNVQTASCLSEEDQIRKYGPLPSVDHLQDLVDRI